MITAQAFERYMQRKDSVKAVGLDADGRILIETEGEIRRLIYVSETPEGIRISHNCPAAEAGKPCWHLAAGADIYSKIRNKKPSKINVFLKTTADAENVPEVIDDLTPIIYGRKGDFALVRLSSAVQLQDEWLEKYNFPPRLLEKIKSFRLEMKKRLSLQEKLTIPQARYIQTEDEVVRAVAALLYGDGGKEWNPVLLKGPRGTGKSTLVDTIAAILMLPVVKITGGIDVNADWLLGTKTIVYRNGLQHIEHEDGLLLSAVKKGALLVIEEVNMLLPEITSLLHSLLDWQRALTVPGVGKIEAPESFRMIACMNVGYAGTRTLNEAFRDRFREIKVSYPPHKTLVEMFEAEGAPEGVAKILAEIFRLLSDRARNGDLEETAVSLRTLLRAARETAELCGSEAGREKAGKIIKTCLLDTADDDYTAKTIEEIVNVVIG